jgi:hypothetical protein
MYMGFDPIYLLGMDGYQVAENSDYDPNHYFNEYAPTMGLGRLTFPKAKLFNARMKMAHGIMQEVALAKGKHIYNATPESIFMAHPRVRLEDIL